MKNTLLSIDQVYEWWVWVKRFAKNDSQKKPYIILTDTPSIYPLKKSIDEFWMFCDYLKQHKSIIIY